MLGIMRRDSGALRKPAAASLGLLILAARANAYQAGPVLHQYPLPPASGALAVAGGYPDFWVTEPDRNALARLALDGSVIEYPLATSGSRPYALAPESSSDGRIVFTEPGTNRIGVMDFTGALTEYDIPTPASDPRGIAAPGFIWFTEYAGNRIGRVKDRYPDPLREFAIPTPNAGPLGIAVGPGATQNNYDMWFTEFLANKIGRIDDNGQITEYAIPTPGSGPTAIVQPFFGDEPGVFFTESNANKIGKITASGVVTEYVIPTPDSRPTQIYAGLDGIWFSEESGGKLGRLSPDGQIREFPLAPGSRPGGLAISFYRPDGQSTLISVWYVDATNNHMGRFSDNRIYALGAGHAASFDTQFALNSVSGRPTKARVGLQPQTVCPGFCFDPSIQLDLPPGQPVQALASEVPYAGEGAQIYFVTATDWSGITDLPEANAWILSGLGLGSRTELPIIDYWTVADAETPGARGRDGSRPSLVFPARRDSATRTDLVLAALETDSRIPFSVSVRTVAPESAPLSIPLYEGGAVTLTDVLKQLGFDTFDGEIRVSLDAISGLAWGVSETAGPDGLSLSAPQVEPFCSSDAPRCRETRRTRTLTRD